MIQNIAFYLDYFIYVLMLVSVSYLFIFVLFSLFGKKKKIPTASHQCRYAVIFPAYKEDKVIESSVVSFLEQDYPSNLFDLIVISDQMQLETNQRLREQPIELLEVHFENSTKAQSLNFAINTLDTDRYDAVIILDADNTVNKNFLTEINNAYVSGVVAAQAHRAAKNQETDIAILDAMSEEINNTIFRKGYDRAGLSCTLSGSGMMFDYRLFKENVSQLSSSGEDKELEALFLKQKIHIQYLEDVFVYDEKTKKTDAFYQQRRRWLAAQYGTLFRSLKDLPKAIMDLNIDYCNKILQWMMFPRIILIGFISMMTILTSVICLSSSIKWWILLGVLLLTFILAVPRNMFDRRLLKALWRIPILFVLMVLNMFRLKGVYRKFIHTDHEHEKAID